MYSVHEKAENRAGTGATSPCCSTLAGRELASLQWVRVGALATPLLWLGAPQPVPARLSLALKLLCSAGALAAVPAEGMALGLTPLEADCVSCS